MSKENIFEKRIPCEGNNAFIDHSYVAGIRQCEEWLVKLQKRFPNLPGIALSLETIKAKSAYESATLMQKDLMFLAKQGFAMDTASKIYFDPNTGEYVVSFHEDKTA